MEGESCAYTSHVVGPVSCSSNKLPHPHYMHACLFLRVWVLNQSQQRPGLQTLDHREFNEIIDSFAIEVEVEAGVLEGARKLDDRLSEVLDLLLG